MKKNVMMRLAAIMLMCVLMTTSVIGGTFAKYTTTTTGFDHARVAQWGVNIGITGGAFKTEYASDLSTFVKDKADNEITVAVQSGTADPNDKVLAPGTTGTFTGIHVTGKPEVAININTEATVTLIGWDVGGNYYCPVSIQVGSTTFNGNDYDNAAAFAAAVEAAIEAANGNYAPNTDLSSVTGLNGDYTWTWAFEGGVEQDDAKDTELANAASLPQIDITITTTITQID